MGHSRTWRSGGAGVYVGFRGRQTTRSQMRLEKKAGPAQTATEGVHTVELWMELLTDSGLGCLHVLGSKEVL